MKYIVILSCEIDGKETNQLHVFMWLLCFLVKGNKTNLIRIYSKSIYCFIFKQLKNNKRKLPFIIILYHYPFPLVKNGFIGRHYVQCNWNNNLKSYDSDSKFKNFFFFV